VNIELQAVRWHIAIAGHKQQAVTGSYYWWLITHYTAEMIAGAKPSLDG
jgi:hypothetical protein